MIDQFMPAANRCQLRENDQRKDARPKYSQRTLEISKTETFSDQRSACERVLFNMRFTLDGAKSQLTRLVADDMA
jgi:hypothetical protein